MKRLRIGSTTEYGHGYLEVDGEVNFDLDGEEFYLAEGADRTRARLLVNLLRMKAVRMQLELHHPQSKHAFERRKRWVTWCFCTADATEAKYRPRAVSPGPTTEEEKKR